MNIAVLSDIHLAPRRTNRCAIGADRLAAHVEYLLDEFDEVVLNGDVWDLSRPAFYGGWRGHYWTCRRSYPRLAKLFDRCRPLVGNHDAALASRGFRASATYHGAIEVYVHHGHLWDRGLKRYQSVERSANFAAGWFDRVGVPILNRGLELVSDSTEKIVAGDLPDVTGARRVLAGGWSLVVQGHAHVQRLERFEEGVYLNTGSQLGNEIEWGWFDTESGEVALMRDTEVVASIDAR
jgi:predicted phosphodiesterase